MNRTDAGDHAEEKVCLVLVLGRAWWWRKGPGGKGQPSSVVSDRVKLAKREDRYEDAYGDVW